MPSNRLRLIPAVIIGLVLLTIAVPRGATVQVPAQNDLDAFMQRVLTRRDDNWKKLQQYILEEQEQIDLRGPGHQPVWGEQREYSWFIRDGYFVRSPLKFNGVTIGEADRRKYEAEFLDRQRQRERRWLRGRPAEEAPDRSAGDRGASSVDGLIRQTREPEFITSAYFLRFKFEEGKYALVGHESLDGRDALRIEYYPARLFLRQQRRAEADRSDPRKARTAELERMMNKVSVVTLWIDPSMHQILQYTFENVDADFLPVQWLVRIGDVRASMTMGQPFPDVWLPRGLEVSAAFTLAVGAFDLRYALTYHDYKLADVASKVTVPSQGR
ncbi:MAG: hypothetical protein DMF92_02215 [Acidobacteria bacterium]|nr:MAG: hypothetical protein DMF92_02215 [Acidobacteriota bacterium]